MYSLRNVFQLGGGNNLRGRESPNQNRNTSILEDAWSWELVNDRDNWSAPNIAGQFGCQGGGYNLVFSGTTNNSH
jgi:hypothetical protein